MSIQALLRPECHDALAALVDIVGTIGPAQVFWEEHSWANKRILPGYRNQYRSGTKLWQDVLRVTTNSFTLFVQALCEQQKKRLAQLRRRLSPMQLEEHSALAAMFCWLVEACVAEQPAMSSDVQHLRQSFINGDHDLMLDLQGLLHEKSPRLSWRDCSALHTAHRNQSARAAAQVTGKNSIVSVDATMLEHSEFALFRQKFEYDLALMEVYRFKVSSQSSLLYHHRLEHIKRRRVQVSEAADVMFQNGCPPRFAFCIANRPGNAVGFLKNHSEEILRAENIRPNTQLAIMVVVNWAAPSTNSAGAMAVQDAILSAVLNGNNCDTLGVVFTPVWERKMAFYTRPNLWCWTE